MLAQASCFAAMGRPLGRGWGPHCRRSQRHWPGAASAVGPPVPRRSLAGRSATNRRTVFPTFMRRHLLAHRRGVRRAHAWPLPPPHLPLPVRQYWEEPLERGATTCIAGHAARGVRGAPGLEHPHAATHSVPPTSPLEHQGRRQPAALEALTCSAESANLQR